MAKICDLCGKGRLIGNSVSHSNIKTKKVQLPNIRRVRAVVNGRTQRVKLCTRCLRGNQIEKAS